MIDFGGTSATMTAQPISGTIVKSRPKSRFTTAHINASTVSDLMRDVNVVILQIMNCCNGAVIIEFVDREDYP